MMTKIDESESKWNDIDCDIIRRKFICQKKASIQPQSRDDIVFEFLKYVNFIKIFQLKKIQIF